MKSLMSNASSCCLSSERASISCCMAAIADRFSTISMCMGVSKSSAKLIRCSSVGLFSSRSHLATEPCPTPKVLPTCANVSRFDNLALLSFSPINKFLATMRFYISAETVHNLTASAIGLEFSLQQKVSFCLSETKCMLFRPFRGISVAASTAKRNLLGVVTETYLRFSRLDQPSNYADQHFFFGA